MELSSVLLFSWTGLAVLGGVILTLCALLVILGTWQSIRGMSPDRLSICAVEPGDCPVEFERANRVRSRVEPLGFEWDGAHLFIASEPVFVGVWRHRADRTWFVLYIGGSHASFEFVTMFEPNPVTTMLSTSNTKDALLLPQPPGRLVAAFARSSVEDLWLRHRATCEALMAEHGIVRSDIEHASPTDLIRDAVFEQVRYVRSLPLWPMRGLWWFLVRRNLLAGRPIIMPFRVDPDDTADAAHEHAAALETEQSVSRAA